jgi:hypothetical protein
MRAGKTLAAAIIAAVVGGFVPGCFLFPDPDPTVGRFCASPSEGGEYCVPSTRDPAGAWGDAVAHGSLPIQMWAEPAGDVSLDDLVKSRDRLGRWFDDIDKVVSYVRDTQANAESYRASMNGRLGQLLREAKNRQASLLAEMPADPHGDFKGALGAKAEAEKEPLLGTIALDKQSIEEARKALDAATGDLAPLATRFADLAQSFSAYRATEVEERDAYQKLGKDASHAEGEDLDGIEQAILETAKAASAAPIGPSLEAWKLSAELGQFALASQASIQPHLEFTSVTRRT